MEKKSKVVTLGFVTVHSRYEVWLAKKKTWPCEGKFNGYGGGVKDGESIEDCMVREFHEESTATTTRDNLVDVGCISFYKIDGIGEPTLICECHMFLITDTTGVMKETAEMGAPIPFFSDRLPFDEMMPSDRLWLPEVLLERKTVSGYVTLNETMTGVVAYCLHFR